MGRKKEGLKNDKNAKQRILFNSGSIRKGSKNSKGIKKSTDRFVEDIIGWFDCDCFTVDEIISDYEKELLIK